jgi:hypothetical protein
MWSRLERRWLGFQFLPPVALTLSCRKYRLKYRKLSLCSGITNRSLWSKCNGDFLGILVGQHVWKRPSASGISCRVRLIRWQRGKRRGERPVTDGKVNEFGAAFVHSPRKSKRQVARQLRMPHSTGRSSVKAFVVLKFTNTNCSNK